MLLTLPKDKAKPIMDIVASCNNCAVEEDIVYLCREHALYYTAVLRPWSIMVYESGLATIAISHFLKPDAQPVSIFSALAITREAGIVAGYTVENFLLLPEKEHIDTLENLLRQLAVSLLIVVSSGDQQMIDAIIDLTQHTGNKIEKIEEEIFKDLPTLVKLTVKKLNTLEHRIALQELERRLKEREIPLKQ